MYTPIQLYIIFINDSYIFVFSDSCLLCSSSNNILFIRYLCNYIYLEDTRLIWVWGIL